MSLQTRLAALIATIGADVKSLSAAALESSSFGRSLVQASNAQAARNTLELGSAATADVTTSATDLTAGRAMTVGYNGLGSLLPPRITDDINLILYGATRAVSGGSVGVPLNEVGVLISTGWDNEQGGLHFYYSLQSNRTFFRRRSSSAWMQWNEFRHADNLIYAINLSGSVVSIGGTTSGANLSSVPVGISYTGTWRNVSGVSVANNSGALWMRV